MSETTYSFRDNSNLVKWIKILIIIFVAINIAQIISNIPERNLLKDLASGVYTDAAQVTKNTAANDTRQLVIGILYTIVFIALGGESLRWIYFANKNSRALGSKNMRFTPGWAIGGYFIPILALWKPYQAMREIYQTSVKRENWKEVPSPLLLKNWWALWIITSILTNASLRLTVQAVTIDQLLAVNMVDTIACILEIPLDFVFLALILRIFNLQNIAYAHSKN